MVDPGGAERHLRLDGTLHYDILQKIPAKSPEYCFNYILPLFWVMSQIL